MKSKAAYIHLNRIKGWKVVLDHPKHIDCTKPIYDSHDTTSKGISMCEEFCKQNNVDIIRICG